MRLYCSLFFCLFGILHSHAQAFFPIKVDKRWGLIDSDGKIVLSPDYEAIGEFKAFGYSVIQKNGGVGLLNQYIREIVPPKYDDIKVLDSTLIAVMDRGEWMVIGLDGRVVLEKGYGQVEVWDPEYLGFSQNDKWGVKDHQGRTIVAPQYDEVSYEEERFFLTRKGKKLGVLNKNGDEIIKNIANEIKLFDDSLLFYKKGNYWGAVSLNGQNLINATYDSYQRLSPNFVKLISNNKIAIYSRVCHQIISRDYDNYYAFSRKFIIAKKDRKLGLVDWCGQEILPPMYDEIQSYDRNLFRVTFNGKWGVVGLEGKQVIPLKYDYIAPLRDHVCVVKKGEKFGVVNFKGDEVVAPQYQRIELENDHAYAYSVQGGQRVERLKIISFDKDGQVKFDKSSNSHFQLKIAGANQSNSTNNKVDQSFTLNDFEWFYSPQLDRFGLRKLSDGSIQIEPTFHFVQIERDLGLTVVGIETTSKYEFERTSFRFDIAYGIVNNDIGALVTKVEFWDIRLEDFYEGYPVARCIFNNGSHGLIDADTIGKIVRRNLAYIGDFQDGVARTSIAGKLSGSMKSDRSLGKLRSYLDDMMAPSLRVDYTEYDQIFQKEASLTCEDCSWGYIDTLGRIVVNPTYTFAQDLVNGVGIVECEGKWGMVDKNAKVLIPCRYDGVAFLENTENKIVRIYIKEPKYGLIDTLGELRVSAVYDEIGSFSEGRLAVKRKGMWGYVDRDGLEVIPCRFKQVSNFSEGLAAVKLGRYWGFVDKQGNVEIDFKYKKAGSFNSGRAWVWSSEGTGYIDPENNYIIAPNFDKAYDFEEGIARVVVDNKYGLINLNGQLVVKPKYGLIEDFDQHGLAVVMSTSDRLKFGLINRAGTEVVSLKYKEIKPFQEGLAVVKKKDYYGFIDIRGKLVIPAIYKKAAGFSEGRAAVTTKEGCGFIDTTGDGVISFEFTKCLDFDDGKAVVYRGIRKAGLVDLNGDFVLKPSLNRLLKFKEGRGLVRDEKYRFYYITEQAGWYDGYYQKASEFMHGVAVVQVNGRWGIINQKGIEIIPPKYDKIESFKEGYAKVRIKGFNGLTNLKGELIVHPNYEYITYAGEGLFRVEQGDKIGYFDVDGKWIWDLSK